MTLHEQEIDELGLWKPRSGFFQYQYRKARAKLMVQQAPADYGARVAFCGYCQSAYLASDAVPNSPCHDTPPVLTYDLERLVDAATFAETFLEAMQATDPEDLLNLITSLGGLARASVAGNTGELSQAPSTAAGADTPASEQVGPLLAPDASVDGTNGPEAPLSSPPAQPVAAEGEPAAPAPSAAPTAKTRTRRQPAAVAS